MRRWLVVLIGLGFVGAILEVNGYPIDRLSYAYGVTAALVAIWLRPWGRSE